MRRILLITVSVIAVGCGNDNNDDDNTNNGNSNSGTTAPAPESPAEVRDWSSVSYRWSGMVADPETMCASGRVVIRPNREITSRECGQVRRATLSTGDDARVEAAVLPVLASYGKRLRCDENEQTMDYEFDMRLASDGKTRKMYSYGDGTCTRGDRGALENLESVLVELSNKYFPMGD